MTSIRVGPPSRQCSSCPCKSASSRVQSAMSAHAPSTHTHTQDTRTRTLPCPPHTAAHSAHTGGIPCHTRRFWHCWLRDKARCAWRRCTAKNSRGVCFRSAAKARGMATRRSVPLPASPHPFSPLLPCFLAGGSQTAHTLLLARPLLPLGSKRATERGRAPRHMHSGMDDGDKACRYRGPLGCATWCTATRMCHLRAHWWLNLRGQAWMTPDTTRSRLPNK